MGLIFTVGTTSQAFMQPFAAQVHEELWRQLQYQVPTASPFGEEGYFSEEVGWSGWRELQEHAAATLGPNNIPHLLAMEAWQGVYLPKPTSPTEIRIGTNPTPLQCASLSDLVQELEQFAAAERLPTDTERLEALWEKYRANDDLIDADMYIQTYVQLLLVARIALKYDLPLWIIK